MHVSHIGFGKWTIFIVHPSTNLVTAHTQTAEDQTMPFPAVALYAESVCNIPNICFEIQVRAKNRQAISTGLNKGSQISGCIKLGFWTKEDQVRHLRQPLEHCVFHHTV